MPSSNRSESRSACSTLLTLCLVVVLSAGFAGAAAAAEPADSGLWVDVDPASLAGGAGERLIVPLRARTLTLDLGGLQADLAPAPAELSGAAGVEVALPLPDGSMARFAAFDSPIMAPGLAAAHPEIRTFSVVGLDEPAATGRIGWTTAGFHAILFTAAGTAYLDPYRRGDTASHQSYWRRDFVKPAAQRPECLVGGDGGDPLAGGLVSVSGAARAAAAPVVNGTTLRTYRLAMAANYEYTQFHSGGLPNVPSKAAALNNGIVPTMNRVNGIYERELAIRMVLIPNEEDIIFDTPADPYVNEDGLSMLETNRFVLDGIIGVANYDVGHVFSTGGGGIAGLGVVCRSQPLSHKAHGVTGNPSPAGDPFDVDYVAHELGHQFGANHTFNGNAGSCSGGNRNAGTAYEVGSGSTIMAYAGICGVQNLQSNSDPYFHLASLEEIVAYATTGAGNNCPARTATGNVPPVVEAGADYTIPRRTPFTLTARATDADGDPLTYGWEEYDLGAAGAGTADNGSSPILRSFQHVADPSRTFPRIPDLLANTTTYGELLPTTTRVMRFRVTARDHRLAGGGIHSDEMRVSVTSSAGPFLVDSPNGGELWIGGGTETVVWDVAFSDQPPVNAAAVDILLSTDGGLTFPIVLATAVPNTGLATVAVPQIDTSTARVKVAGSGNVFFDISNAEFTIEPGSGPPRAFDDAATTPHNTPVTIDVLANDVDPDGDALSVVAVESPTPAGGTATIDGDRVRYTPAAGFDGRDSFAYTVSDGTGSDSATVRVTVEPACPPSATGAYAEDFESGAPGWAVDTARNDVPASAPWTALPDPASHSPAMSMVSDASTLSPKDDRLVSPPLKISPTTVLRFWHRFGFEPGYDGGVLEVSGDDGATWQDVVAAGGVFLTGGYNGTISSSFGSPIGGRAAWTGDVPANPTNQSQVLVEVALGALAQGEVGTLLRWRLGTDTLAAGATPGTVWSIDDVELTDLLEPGVCIGPVAIDDSAATDEGTPVTIDLVANDFHPGGQPFSVTAVGQAANGSTTDHGDGTATYAPDGGFHGVDSFSYTICDGDDECDSAVVTVTVRDVNLSPNPSDDTASTPKGTPVTIDVLANDVDPDGDALSIGPGTDATSAEGGVVSHDGALATYAPPAGFDGLDTFDYEVCDDGQPSLCASATVTVTVTGGEASEGRVHGSGHWEDAQEKPEKINFSFDARVKKGKLDGKLKVKDKGADVEIDADEITSLSRGSGICNGAPTGAGAFAFEAVGSFEIGDVEVEGATFRVCGDDRSKKGKGDETHPPDRLYVECLTGCTYDTASRLPNDAIDGGNIHLHDPIVEGSAATGAVAAQRAAVVTGSAAAASADVELGVLELDPVLLDSSLAGAPFALTARYERPVAVGPTGGAAVTLHWRSGAGVEGTTTALADAFGNAVFLLTAGSGVTEYHTTVGELDSNRVEITSVP